MEYDSLTDAQKKQVADARRAYLKAISIKATNQRRLKREAGDGL